LKYTPSKSAGKKDTPQKGKASTKRSVSKKTPALPSPSGKQSTKTTDQMTMAQFKKYLDWHEKKKGGKASSGGKQLGKRSAASGKSTAKGTKRAKK
jgi:hypothetical protein